MDHHDDAEFLATLRANRSGESFSPFQAYEVLGQSADQALYQSAFPSLEIAEECGSATTVDFDDLAGSH